MFITEHHSTIYLCPKGYALSLQQLYPIALFNSSYISDPIIILLISSSTSYALPLEYIFDKITMTYDFQKSLLIKADFPFLSSRNTSTFVFLTIQLLLVTLLHVQISAASS